MNVKSNELFAKRLRSLREEAGLSQVQLAEKLNVSRGSISYYENCDRIPDINFLQAAHEFFGVDYDYLLGESSIKSASTADYGRYRELDSEMRNLTEQQADSLIKNIVCILHYLYMLDRYHIDNSAICLKSFLTQLDELNRLLELIYYKKNRMKTMEKIIAATPPHTSAYYFDMLQLITLEHDIKSGLYCLDEVLEDVTNSIRHVLDIDKYSALLQDESFMNAISKWTDEEPQNKNDEELQPCPEKE